MLEGWDHEPNPSNENGNGRKGCSCTGDYERRNPEAQEAGAVPEATEGFPSGWDHGEPAVEAAEGTS